MKKVVFSPAFLLFWVVAIGAISVSLIRSLLGARTAQARFIELQARNAALEKTIAQLQVKITDAQTPFAKEKIIRDELGLQLPGETVVEMNQQANLLASPTPTPVLGAETSKDSVPGDTKNQPIYRQWLELFFGR
ncbi:MAG TPA: septum formation initiator family protein [Candidatus Saccharimonadia bacterium]|nr:septum formation initiator family protein [Candidatus Saccharimonadia bacterium]